MQLLALKITISEMKISLDWINNRLRHCERKEKHSELEYIFIGIIQTKAQRKKKVKKINQQILINHW